jgi:hypothetical protein
MPATPLTAHRSIDQALAIHARSVTFRHQGWSVPKTRDPPNWGRGVGPGGDPDAIDRLDTDLDTHEVLPFGSLCESLYPAAIHLAARTRAGTRPALKSGGGRAG